MNPRGIPAHFIRLDNGTYAHPSRVRGRLEAGQPKPESGRALVEEAQPAEGSGPGMGQGGGGGSKQRRRPARPSGVVIVHLHARLRRIFDEHDNLRASMKPLVDAIAESIGVKDNDRRVIWEYSQSTTRGDAGVTVTMETNL